MNDEIFKPIPGWEGYYSVSNHGNVRSEQRLIKEKSTNKIYEIPEKILKKSLDNSGKKYYRVSLSRSSIITYLQVHRLVCWAFIGEQKKGMEVRHLDGNSRNNNLSNLCYGTKSDNMQDAIKHGTFPLLEKRPGAKLNDKIVKEITLAKGTLAELSRRFGVCSGVIRQIKMGQTWKNITTDERLLNPYIPRKKTK